MYPSKVISASGLRMGIFTTVLIDMCFFAKLLVDAPMLAMCLEGSPWSKDAIFRSVVGLASCVQTRTSVIDFQDHAKPLSKKRTVGTRRRWVEGEGKT